MRITVQDITIPGDFGLDNGTRFLIEHRFYGESPKQVMLLQLLIKSYYALLDAARPESIAKYGNKLSLIVQTKIEDAEYIEFLKRHNISYFLTNGKTGPRLYFDLTKNNQIAKMDELLPMIRDVADLFTYELQKSNDLSTC